MKLRILILAALCAVSAFAQTVIDDSFGAQGTGGAGFIQIANQSAAPSTPTASSRIYFDSSNRLSWKGTNGFVRTFDGTANTADRIYTLPNAAGVVAISATALTSGRVPFVTTGGLLTDASTMTFSSGTLTTGTGISTGLGTFSNGITLSGASGAATTISTSTANANVIIAPNGTGQVLGPAGAAATPGYSFNGATGYGMHYSSGGSSLFLSANGSTPLRLQAAVAILAADVTPLFDATAYSIGSSGARWKQLFLSATGIKLGDGTNGPTITATGSSPNESLVLAPAGSGSVVTSGKSVVSGSTRSANLGGASDSWFLIAGYTYNVGGDGANAATITTSTTSANSDFILTPNGTGALQIAGTSPLKLGGTLISAPDTRTGAGAVSVTTLTTALTSTGGSQAITLADGTNGQIKTIIHDVDGGSMVLTPTTKTGWSTATFTNAGDTLTVQFLTTRGWFVLSSNGTTVAP